MSRFFAECWRADGATVANGDDELLEVYIRGWDIGVKVTLSKTKDNRDLLTVEKGGGSNDPNASLVLMGWQSEPDPKDRRER